MNSVPTGQTDSGSDECKKTLAGLESSIQQGQQQLSELRATESRLRNSIAGVEAAAKARAEREAREAQAVRDRQKKRRAKAPPINRPKAKNR